MRIAITGARGQLGQALWPLLQAEHELLGLDLPEHDITERAALLETLRAFRPQVIVHAAAWTDVDGCARDPQRAYVINGVGTQGVALCAAELDAELVYISSNEVFPGTASAPYLEWETPQPINPYGQSKLAGEWYVCHLTPRFMIVRTAWLYGPGGRNFPHRIMQLADERGALRVVADEVGSPTYTLDLAAALVQLMETHAYGVYHLVNEGVASRYEFACEILRRSGRGHVPVTPIKAEEFVRASTPPRYAPLANVAAAALGIRLRPWQEALGDFLQRVSG